MCSVVTGLQLYGSTDTFWHSIICYSVNSPFEIAVQLGTTTANGRRTSPEPLQPIAPAQAGPPGAKARKPDGGEFRGRHWRFNLYETAKVIAAMRWRGEGRRYRGVVACHLQGWNRNHP